MVGGLLVVDSGGSKTEWRYGDGPVHTRKARSEGMNPNMLSAAQVSTVLKGIRNWLGDLKVEEIHFYGAGCGRRDTALAMRRQLTALGVGFDQIYVNTDILAAAQVAFEDGPGIGAVIGTGAVAFAYDGVSITHQCGGLGYLLGDEAGGIALGKALVVASLRGQLPEELCAPYSQFTGGLDSDKILSIVYQKDQAKALEFLSRQTLFLEKHAQHPWVRATVKGSIALFVNNHVKTCMSRYKGPLVFLGSLSILFQDIVRDVCRECALPKPAIFEEPVADALYRFIRARR